MRAVPLFALFLACAAAATAQSKVAVGSETVHEGQYIDLDTGTVLSKARFESARAEFRMESDGKSMSIVPCDGATVARWDGRLGADGPEPDPETYSDKPVKVEGQMSVAGKTSEGRFFKALLTPPWPASFSQYNPMLGRPVGAELQVDFAVRPDGPAAGAPVRELGAHFAGGRGVVTWERPDSGKWRVDWFRAGVDKADGSATSEKGRVLLEGLALEKVYRVVVTPLGEGGAEGEPRTVPLYAGERGLKRFQFETSLQASFQQGIEVDLRKGAAGSDPDCTFDFTTVRAPDGGGVQWLGDTEAAFEDTLALPEFGYRPRVLISMKGGVFAVRMRDGRYGKVWFDWDRMSHDRDRMVAVHGILLEGGGLRIPAPPQGLRGTFEDGAVRLGWGAAKGASQYIVTRRGKDGDEEVGRTERRSFVDEKPTAFETVEYGVSWIDADGVRSAPAVAQVDTWPPEYSRGTATIEWIGGSFDFRTMKATQDRTGRGGGEADLRFDRRGMAAEGIPLLCDSGIEKDVPGEFGKFDWKEAVRFKRQSPEGKVYFPHRLEQPVVVRLLTRDGGYAHVRFEQGEGFGLKMTWVHLSPPKPADFATMAKDLTARAPQATDEEAKAFAGLAKDLEADAAETRDAAEKQLQDAGMKAAGALIDAARKTEEPEAKARLTRLIERLWLDLE